MSEIGNELPLNQTEIVERNEVEETIDENDDINDRIEGVDIIEGCLCLSCGSGTAQTRM